MGIYLQTAKQRKEMCIAAAENLETLAAKLRSEEIISMSYRWNHEGTFMDGEPLTRIECEVVLSGIIPSQNLVS